MLVLVGLDISNLYLFHLIVLLNRSKSLLSSSVDKVTTGTYNFVSVNLNTFVGLITAATVGIASGLASLVTSLVTKQFSD